MKTDDQLAVFIAFTLVAIIVTFALGMNAIFNRRDALDAVCKRGGYDSREVLADGRVRLTLAIA